MYRIISNFREYYIDSNPSIFKTTLSCPKRLPERQKLDEQEASLQLENRKRVIARANRLLYDESDRIKSFHSKMQLADTLAEREAQVNLKDELNRLEQIREEHFSWNDEQCQQYAENQKDSGKLKVISDAGDQLVSLEAQEMKYLTPMKATAYSEACEDDENQYQSAEGKQQPH